MWENSLPAGFLEECCSQHQTQRGFATAQAGLLPQGYPCSPHCAHWYGLYIHDGLLLIPWRTQEATKGAEENLHVDLAYRELRQQYSCSVWRAHVLPRPLHGYPWVPALSCELLTLAQLVFHPSRMLLSITELWPHGGCCGAQHRYPNRCFTELQGSSSQELPIPTAIPAARPHLPALGPNPDPFTGIY